MLLRIAVAGLLGASLGPASPRPDTPDQAPAQAPPRTADQLIARFRKAHESRAIATILGLIYWGNAEPEMHRTMERNIAADFGLVITMESAVGAIPVGPAVGTIMIVP